jgi:hypothetical protein
MPDLRQARRDEVARGVTARKARVKREKKSSREKTRAVTRHVNAVATRGSQFSINGDVTRLIGEPAR